MQYMYYSKRERLPGTFVMKTHAEAEAAAEILWVQNHVSRLTRKTFDTSDTKNEFGPIRIEFGKVQSKVSLKYDSWHKDVLSKFGNLLGNKMSDFHTSVSKVREYKYIVHVPVFCFNGASEQNFESLKSYNVYQFFSVKRGFGTAIDWNVEHFWGCRLHHVRAVAEAQDEELGKGCRSKCPNLYISIRVMS